MSDSQWAVPAESEVVLWDSEGHEVARFKLGEELVALPAVITHATVLGPDGEFHTIPVTFGKVTR